MIENKDYFFPNSGVEWIFQSMILANNYSSEDYNDFKIRLIKHIEKLHNNGEPNLTEYYNKLEQIYERLEKIKAPNNL